MILPECRILPAKHGPGLEALICSSLPQELVGQYFFSEKQLERLHKLHTTMRKCGVAFVLVSAATVAGLVQVFLHALFL